MKVDTKILYKILANESSNTHKKWCIPCPSGICSKYAKFIQSYEKSMYITPSKKLNNLEIKGDYFNLIEGIYGKPQPALCLMVKDWKLSSEIDLTKSQQTFL